MTEETKNTLQVVLELLRATCIEHGVSIAVDKDTGDLNFFDTDTYLKMKQFKGIKVPIEKLVK